MTSQSDMRFVTNNQNIENRLLTSQNLNKANNNEVKYKAIVIEITSLPIISENCLNGEEKIKNDKANTTTNRNQNGNSRWTSHSDKCVVTNNQNN